MATVRRLAFDVDDIELLAAVRARDPSAATALHARLRPVVERAIRRLLDARDIEREDLAQQAMIGVNVAVEGFRGECSLDAWASSVATHVACNHIRRKTLERRLFDGFPEGDPDAVASLDSLTRATAARSALRRVFAHLSTIDPTKALPYVLHDVCGYDLREVAQITESSVSATQTRLVRGRRELHVRLAADPDLRRNPVAPNLAINRRGSGHRVRVARRGLVALLRASAPGCG